MTRDEARERLDQIAKAYETKLPGIQKLWKSQIADGKTESELMLLFAESVAKEPSIACFAAAFMFRELMRAQEKLDAPEADEKTVKKE